MLAIAVSCTLDSLPTIVRLIRPSLLLCQQSFDAAHFEIKKSTLLTDSLLISQYGPMPRAGEETMKILTQQAQGSLCIVPVLAKW